MNPSVLYSISLSIYKCLNIVGIIKINFLFHLVPKSCLTKFLMVKNINRIFLPIHFVCCPRIDIYKIEMMVEGETVERFQPNGTLLDLIA